MAEKKHVERPERLTVDKPLCIWMNAGVVQFKLCNMNYDCMNCPFDKGIGRKLARESDLAEVGANWRKVFNSLPEEKRLCRHMLNGHVGYKICVNGFRCHKCEFDQMIDDEMGVLDPVVPPGTGSVEGFLYPDTYYYHRGHGYTMLDYGGRIRVGMDDFSSRLLGRPDKVEVLSVGETVRQNQIGWTVERDGHSASMFSPVDAVVGAVNYKAVKDPILLNSSPYEKGWLYLLEPIKLKENLKDLLYGDEVTAWARAESNRLRSLVGAEIGPTASAGGALTRDIYGALPELGWDRLVHEFLLTGS